MGNPGGERHGHAPASQTYIPINFTGTDDKLNVFRVDAADLQASQEIEIKVPDGATTLINVTGSTYTSGFRPTTSMRFWDGNGYVQFGDNAPNDRVARARKDLLWSFPDADSIQLGPNLDWQGSVLAPRSFVLLADNTRFHGTLVAQIARAAGNRDVAGLRRLPAAAVPAGPDGRRRRRRRRRPRRRRSSRPPRRR